MGTMLGCWGLLLVASRAAGSIASEKERDCWTSLISTPLEPGEIVWAKIAGSVWSLRGLVMLLMLIWGLGVLLDPQIPRRRAVPVRHVSTVGLLRRRVGREFFAAVPQFAPGDGRHAGHAMLVGGGYLFCCMPVMMVGSFHEGVMLIFAPFVPFLLAMPGVVYLEGSHFSQSSTMGVAVFAYILGTIGYFVAALVLVGHSISSFDRRTDRTRIPAPGPQPIVAATVIDEP